MHIYMFDAGERQKTYGHFIYTFFPCPNHSQNLQNFTLSIKMNRRSGRSIYYNVHKTWLMATKMYLNFGCFELKIFVKMMTRQQMNFYTLTSFSWLMDSKFQMGARHLSLVVFFTLNIPNDLNRDSKQFIFFSSFFLYFGNLSSWWKWINISHHALKAFFPLCSLRTKKKKTFRQWTHGYQSSINQPPTTNYADFVCTFHFILFKTNGTCRNQENDSEYNITKWKK